MVVLSTSYYFYSFLFLFLNLLISIAVFPIIADLVFTLSYHVTFEFDFWYGH